MKHSEAVAKIEESLPEFKILDIKGSFEKITSTDAPLPEGTYFIANINVAIPITTEK